jgi:hypothetical protein
MCMDIRLYLDTCISERHRDARVGVRMRVRVRARVRPCGLHLPQGTIAAPNATVCLSRACGCGCVHAWRLSMASAPFDPTSAHCCAAGAGRTRARCSGRDIGSTKVKALREWLGQCKLLDKLCVRATGYTHAHTQTCIYIYIHIFFTSIYMCIYIYLYVYLYIYIYIYIYLYISIYKYIYIYISIDI